MGVLDASQILGQQWAVFILAVIPALGLQSRGLLNLHMHIEDNIKNAHTFSRGLLFDGEMICEECGGTFG